MRVLVASRADSASINIRDRLLEQSEWEEVGRFRDAPVHKRVSDLLVEIEGPSIRDETLAAELGALGDPAALWFLSRHRAASGKPSLTVHPIGNHGQAKYGGQPGTLSPAAPRDMGALLRRLRIHRDRKGLPHEVTYEATHHGPLTDLPSLFVEIGSDETWYEDRPSGEALAAAVIDVLDGGGTTKEPVVVGVGGGHYVPRHTDLGKDGRFDFGHLVPAYAIDPEAEGPDLLKRAVEATPGCEGVYLHKKGLKGPQRQWVRRQLEGLDVPLLGS